MRIWRDYVRRHWRLVALVAIPIVLVGATAGGYVYLSHQAGELIQAGDPRVIYQIPAWVIGLSAIRAIAMYAQAVLLSDLALRVLKDIQTRMFGSLLDADYGLVASDPVGGLVSRFVSDINVISEGITRTVNSLVRDVVMLLGVFIAMLQVDWALALGVIGVLLVATGPLGRIARRARAQTKDAQAQMGALSALLFESLSAAQLVRTYGLERYEAERAEREFEARRRLQLKMTYNRARSDPLLEALGGLAAAAVFAIIGFRVAQGEAGAGELLALIAAIATASAAARSLGTYNTVLNESLAATERVFALVDREPTVREPAAPRPLPRPLGRIAFQDVTFGYPGGPPAVRATSFEVRRGETVALVGPSGAGKSTIFKLIPRLFDPSGGRIDIDGADIREFALRDLRSAVAIVSQDVTLFNDTIRNNIALGRLGATDDEIIAAAHAAAAHEFITALPGGYDAPCGERGAMLSGGERQRIALARAFLRDAPILLLDEATSALDAQSERAIQGALERLRSGRATLVIAHRLATVRDADLILVLKDGEIVERGRHDELVAQNGLYARLARLQFRDEADAFAG